MENYCEMSFRNVVSFFFLIIQMTGTETACLIRFKITVT